MGAISDFVRSISSLSNTSTTTASTTSMTSMSSSSKTSLSCGIGYDEDCSYDVENQKQRATTNALKSSPSKKDVSISKQEAARRMERARVLASVEERQRQLTVKTLLFLALVISLFVLNQRIRSTTPEGSDDDGGTYYATIIEHMLAGIKRIRNNEQQEHGPD